MQEIIEKLLELLVSEDLKEIRSVVKEIRNSKKESTLENGNIIVDSDILNEELQQILDTKGLDRTKHYVRILHKSLTEFKQSKVSDMNLNRWKEYEDIMTDSLWLIDKRDSSGAHSNTYHGNYIPQIPNQFIKRFTKKGDTVIDPFLGGGTTMIETQRLGRNCVGVELQEDIADFAEENLSKEPNKHNVINEIINSDSMEVNFREEFDRLGIDKAQLVLMHPPYWNIIKFSDDEKDLSNCNDLETFLENFGKIVDNTTEVLEKGRHFVLVISDMYAKSEWIPLGFYSMQEVLKRNYKLKSIVVKNFKHTKGKDQQSNLWRYRAIIGGFYVFKHEYIFLFEKK
ncbi:MAG: DNA methyltransferase [Candidatus Muirbacterium halophilum]|nr:DNA methyltransferase [Candidatus Muirbacterium halophilum]